MVSKLAVGIVVVIVVVGGGAAAYVLTRPSEVAETYTLTTSVSPSGGGSVSPSSGTYDAGTSVTLTATPASGYSFSHWGGDTSGTSTSVTITMNSDKDVTAYFTAVPTYELIYDYEDGEYYNYETTTTSTSTYDNMETETSSSSVYSMQVTAVEDDEITAKYISTETIGPPYLETEENVDVTLAITMSKKGEMLSWEIENVAPPEYWENVEEYENSMMIYWQLFGFVFPEEAVPIGHEWENSIEVEMPWSYIMLPMSGESSAHFVGEESIAVEAGTFNCWRLDYSASISGELTVDNHTVTMDMTVEGASWLDKQNCAQVKSTMSYAASSEYDGYTGEHLSESVTELIEYGTV